MKWAAMAGRRDAGTAVRNAAWTIALLTALPTFRLSAQDAQRGRAVYEKWCLECHGEKGEGAFYPKLQNAHDIGMLQTSNRTCLHPEALALIR